MSQESTESTPSDPSSAESSRNDGDGGSGFTARNLNGLRPTTKHDSKMVVLAAERGDRIEIDGVVESFQDDRVPDAVRVLKRDSTYYGPKLLVHAELEGRDYNYLITAPGPASELMLWGAETAEGNTRSSWYRLAEIAARLSENQPSYEICPQCRTALRSIEHERMASLGMCDHELP